jgi:general secretion pathway protein K
MQKDHVPSSSQTPDYDRGALPYAPPLRPLRSYSELAAIDYAREIFYDEEGRPNQLWHQFVNAISLFDFKQTNLNGGRQDALSAIGSLDSSQRRQLDEYLSGTGSRAQTGPGFFGTPADATGILGAGTIPAAYGTQISALRVIVTIREGRTVFKLSTVIAPAGGATTVEALKNPPNKTANPTGTASADTKQTSAQTDTTAASATAKKLNYPFTLLEIRENAEISPVPVPSPKA